MTAEILCVGTELLLGDIVNTNAAYLARELAALGIQVYHQSVVGDNPQRLKSAMAASLENADLVITTGGLGPTYDDLTKETAAELFGREMAVHTPSLERIRAYFNRTGREMTVNNEKQAVMPEGAIVFENNYGTAPGLALEHDGHCMILLPGPPKEMEPMFSEEVAPYLKKKTNSVLFSKWVHIFGMGESAVENRLRDMMVAGKNPTIAPYAKEGEVQLRVTASAESQEEAEKLIDPVIGQIRKEIGGLVYGVDTKDLQTAVVRALIAQGKTVATAESCTGGLVAKRITEVPGSSGVFGFGAVTYSNGMKEKILGVQQETLEAHGAVSPQTAQEMARGIRKVSGADIGISLTGIAGPDGGTAQKPVGLVYIGVSSDNYEEVKELRLSRGRRNERESIRYMASSHALALVLKALGVWGENPIG